VRCEYIYAFVMVGRSGGARDRVVGWLASLDLARALAVFVLSTPAEIREQGGMKQIVEQGLNLSGS
jgi:hypothetical protein